MNKVFSYFFKKALFLRLSVKFLIRDTTSEMSTVIVRRFYRECFDIDIGLYSYGIMKMKNLPRGLVVGRYVSVADGVQIFRRNHPMNTFTQHPFFYNSKLGYVENDTIMKDSENPLIIGHDVWIGANVIILPSCSSIGDGAVIGAGSIVTDDVLPYSISAGNPCKYIKMRFNDETIDSLKTSEWWKMSIENLVQKKDSLPL